MSVNIVLLTRNRKALYRQCIESLHAHTDQSTFNVTVVDDGSDEPVQVGPLQNVSVLRVARSGHVLSQLKNLGVYWSEQRFGRGDWLYLGDADTYFTPGWLPKLIDTAEATESFRFRLWGGQVHPFHQMKSVLEIDAITVSEHELLDGPSWLMRWQTWREFGPLDRTTAAGTCKSEDVVFGLKLCEAGHLLGCIQPHVVIHTGLRNTDGEMAVGADVRALNRVPGVLYE
jgi:GT2 family glycosyltransferase